MQSVNVGNTSTPIMQTKIIQNSTSLRSQVPEGVTVRQQSFPTLSQLLRAVDALPECKAIWGNSYRRKILKTMKAIECKRLSYGIEDYNQEEWKQNIEKTCFRGIK